MGHGMPTDAERLDFLERWAKRSRTGISFDWIPAMDGERSGYRFMTFHNIRDAKGSLRGCIDAELESQVALAQPR